MKFKLRLVGNTKSGVKIQQLCCNSGVALTAVSRVLKRKLTARIFDLTKCMIYDSKCVPYKGNAKSPGTAQQRTHTGVAGVSGDEREQKQLPVEGQLRATFAWHARLLPVKS